MVNGKIIDENGNIIAQVLDFSISNSNEFYTDDTDEFQIGFQYHQESKMIDKHIHNKVRRTLNNTSEFIFVIEGRIDCSVYDVRGNLIKDLTIQNHQALLQHVGGHSFRVFPDTKFFEIKQGPYLGQKIDKKYENSSK